ncbi:hypothetical protein [Borrelia persica]|uniref:hypothetical protein n=1 Tax=Borrelia persica TaxID=44448 RepID=UPI00135F10D3|nr:hypothetical protein [Borrelia persica]
MFCYYFELVKKKSRRQERDKINKRRMEGREEKKNEYGRKISGDKCIDGGGGM